MIDLPSQSKDSGGGPADPPAVPCHDAISASTPPTRDAGRGRFAIADHAEIAVQFLSRWAGPAALVATLILLGWLFFG